MPDKYRWIWLLVISVVFYLSISPLFFPLLAILILVNFRGGILLARSMAKGNDRWFLFLLITTNILAIIIFKFLASHLTPPESLISAFSFLRPVTPFPQLLLPLGISYLVFTVISYHVEIKRKKITPETHLGYFSLYLLFFPRISQGPIERPQDLLPQIRKPLSFDVEQVASGLRLILWGYFKKLVVADRLAIYVNIVYNYNDLHNGTTLFVATVFFAFQIYADFSGYTDIALGTARILGIRLTDNFQRPYFATSVRDFWNRWHISFSSWLRDYLFLPLAYAISKRLKQNTYLSVSTEKWIYLLAIIATFFVCGLWHGSEFHFLIWGVAFGVILAFSNWTSHLQTAFRKRFHIKKKSTIYLVLKIPFTFLTISLIWIFFRADSSTTAFSILSRVFTAPGNLFIGDPGNFFYSVMALLLLVAAEIKVEFLGDRYLFFKHPHILVRLLSYLMVIVLIGLFGVFGGDQFIYFKF